MQTDFIFRLCGPYSVAALHQGAPGQMIYRPGSSPGSALPIPAYCFASIIVWTENNNVTTSDRFICFILTVKRRWRPVFRGRQLNKGRQLFWGKSASGWPGWRIFWPQNHLAPLLRWRRHCPTAPTYRSCMNINLFRGRPYVLVSSFFSVVKQGHARRDVLMISTFDCFRPVLCICVWVKLIGMQMSL